MSSSDNHRGTSRYYKEDSSISKRGRKYHPPSHHIPNHHNGSFNYQQFPNNPAPYPQSSQSNPFSSRRQEPSSSGIPNGGQQLNSSSINHPSNDPHSSYSSESQYNRGWYGQTRRTNSYRSGRPINFSTMPPVSNSSVPGSIRSTHGMRDDLNNNPITSSPNSFKHSYMNGPVDYSNGRYPNDYSRGEYFESYRNGPPSSTGVEAPYLNGNLKRGSRDRFGPFTSSYSMRSGDALGGSKNRGSDLIVKDPRYHNSQPNDYRGESYNRNPRPIPSHHREEFRSDELDYYRPAGSNQSSTDLQNSSPSGSRNQKYPSHSSKLSADPKIFSSSDNVTHTTPGSITPKASDLNSEYSNDLKVLETETEEIIKPTKVHSEVHSSNTTDQNITELVTNNLSENVNKAEKENSNDSEKQEEKKDFQVTSKEEKNCHNDRDTENNPLKDFEKTSVNIIEEQKQVQEEKKLPDDENAIITNDNIMNNDNLKGRDLESNEKENLKVTSSIEHKGAKEFSDIDFSDVKGCIFPMRKAEFRAWQLSHHSKSKRRQHLTYLNKDRIDYLSQYDFYDASLLIFRQADAYNLFNVFKSMYRILQNKKNILTDEFVYRNKLWKTRTRYMDRQLENFYQSEKEQKEKAKIEDQKPSNTRRGRHHGDSVRTEAEFMEILATLEQERERDPLIRAQYGAATIPDMTLDPVEKYAKLRFMDSNNLVTDKEAWANRIETDPIDSFTESEHEKFCEAFTLYPKRFGRISQFLGGLRSPEECVLHYYKTKKNRTNYKQLVANKNKKGKRKPLKKKKDITRGRTEASTPEYTTADSNVSTPLNDSEVDKVSAEAIGDKRKNSFTSTNTKKQKLAPEENIVQSKEANDSSHLSNLKASNTEIKLEQAMDVPNAQPKLEVTLDLKGVSNSKLSSPIQADHSIDVKQADENHILAVSSGAGDLPYDSPILAEGINNSKKSRKGRRKVSTEEGERSHKDRTHISSYWSVQESGMFPTLLAEYGTDWEIIAKAIGTKTSAMVRNYYQRSLADNPDWKTISSIADIKRQPDINVGESDKKFVESRPMLSPSQPQNGPPLGFFYKKPIPSYTSAPASSIPLTSSITTTDNAYHLPGTNPYYTSPPVFEATSNVTQPLDTSKTAPALLPQYNKQSSDNYQSTSSAVAPINRDIMNMNSLLNSSSNDHPPQTSASTSSISTKIHLPPLNLPSIPNPIPIPSLPKGKYSIMNLLNATDATQTAYYQSSTPTTHTPNTVQSSLFRPTISNIMNSTQPVSVYHTESIKSPSLPSSEQHQTSNGMSALDALARVAFERK